MIDSRFRVLFRQFLVRIADLELLSPQGDMTRLLGQFGALLLSIGILFSLRVMSIDPRLPPERLLINSWGTEHALIAVTMLTVGIFAVLSWDSTFPDLQDVLVLAPLPVPAHTLFLAKAAASASALSLTVIALNLPASVALPLALPPESSSLLGLILSPDRYRVFVAYWLTVLAAGTFIFCSVLALQGLAAQALPRRWFLRMSAALQMGAFCLFVSVYFLQPSLANPAALSAPENQRSLAWLPSYWFLGLFQELNGSMHGAMIPLAHRARYALAIVVVATAAMYTLSYFRTLKRIVEEPDIVRRYRHSHWLPAWGGSLGTAILQFSIRTLLRSRRHRLLMGFYLGAGFAIMVMFMGLPRSRQQLSVDHFRHIFSSIVMLSVCVLGTRVVFTIPFELRANWSFRMTEVRPVQKYMKAITAPLFAIGVIPVWSASAVFFLAAWDWSLAAKHVAALGLLGAGLAWLSLYGFQKIPFTCSWLPGKSFVHMMFLAALGALLLTAKAAAFEWRILADNQRYLTMAAILTIAALAARWLRIFAAKQEEAVVQFEEVEPPAILELGLRRRGVLPD